MSEPATVTIDPNRFAALIDMRERSIQALAQFNTAKATAKDKHKAYEAARDTFEREWDRFVRSTRGEDLPLFSSQTDAIAAAQADPIVAKLVDRLISRGHDVNALIVHGYTEEERNWAAQYLDLMDERERFIAEGADPSEVAVAVVPPFLTPQPLTAVEMADLINRLSESECRTVEPDEIQAWTQAQLADVKAWLTDVETVKAKLGDAVTFDDLPTAPACLADPDEDDDGSEHQAEA